MGILYLYLWYSHTISVSNDCIWGSKYSEVSSPFWYWFQSHVSLHVGMDIRCLPELSYMCAEFCCICMVCVWVFMSLLGLHYVMLMFVSGMCVGGEINRGSCLCS